MQAERNDCQTCLAVSGGGRIRLTETTALLLVDLARTRRRSLVSDRRYAKENGLPEVVENTKAQLRDVDLLIDETLRTQSEMGWLDGQPVGTHS